MSNQVECPHCGRTIKLIPMRDKRQRRQKEFENVQKYNVPVGRWRSLFWFLKGNKPTEPEPEQPTRQNVTVRGIVRQGHTIHISEFDPSITFDELVKMAHLYLTKNQWSRRFFKRRINLSQTKYELICDEFKRFGYLRVDGTKPTITPTGRALCRGLVKMQTTGQ